MSPDFFFYSTIGLPYPYLDTKKLIVSGVIFDMFGRVQKSFLPFVEDLETMAFIPLDFLEEKGLLKISKQPQLLLARQRSLSKMRLFSNRVCNEQKNLTNAHND